MLTIISALLCNFFQPAYLSHADISLCIHTTWSNCLQFIPSSLEASLTLGNQCKSRSDCTYVWSNLDLHLSQIPKGWLFSSKSNFWINYFRWLSRINQYLLPRQHWQQNWLKWNNVYHIYSIFGHMVAGLDFSIFFLYLLFIHHFLFLNCL